MPRPIEFARHASDADVIHIWHIPLAQPQLVIDSLKPLLSADEIQRANRFVFDDHRQRFIVARTALRKILSSYLKQQPRELCFSYNRHGKPSVEQPAGGDRVCFNLSHSGDLALCAVALNRELGIDIEIMRHVSDADRMAARYFHPLENAAYEKLSPPERPAGFLTRWTMKEAYIKARGEGLSIPLDQFMIPAEPNAGGFHPVNSVDPADDAHWSIRLVQPIPGYVAAIAAIGDQWQIEYRQWEASGC